MDALERLEIIKTMMCRGVSYETIELIMKDFRARMKRFDTGLKDLSILGTRGLNDEEQEMYHKMLEKISTPTEIDVNDFI